MLTSLRKPCSNTFSFFKITFDAWCIKDIFFRVPKMKFLCNPNTEKKVNAKNKCIC